MAYTPINDNTIVIFSNAWFDASNLLNILNNALGDSFQVQINRTDLANLIRGAMVSVVNATTRFPERTYIYRYDDQIKVAVNNVLGAVDTKNRVVEVADGSAPSANVELNAVRRTDDSTVATRNAIQNLLDLIIQKTGFYNRTTFEAAFGLTWA